MRSPFASRKTRTKSANGIRLGCSSACGLTATGGRWAWICAAVLLMASGASGEQVEGKSDQNVLVVVDAINRALLQQLAQTSRAWIESGNPPPLTLTYAEWKGSADIFPMEYADILERHRVLAGENLFSGIHVRPQDLRLQVEREAMGTLLRLRAGLMNAGSETKRQAALLTDSLSSLLVIFRAVMRLHDAAPPRDPRAVAKFVATKAGFDGTAFDSVIAAAREGKPLAANDTAGTLDAYVAGMEALVAYLDGYQLPAEA